MSSPSARVSQVGGVQSPTEAEYLRRTKDELEKAYTRATKAFDASTLPRVQPKSGRSPTKADYAKVLTAADKLGAQAQTPQKGAGTTAAGKGQGGGDQDIKTPHDQQPATAPRRIYTAVATKDAANPTATAFADFANGGADTKKGIDWVDNKAGRYISVAYSGPRVVVALGRRGLQLLDAASMGPCGYHGARPEMVRATVSLKGHLEQVYPQEARTLYERIGIVMSGVPADVLRAKGADEPDDVLFKDGRVIYIDPTEREVQVMVNMMAVMMFGDLHTAGRTSYDNAQHTSTILSAIFISAVEFGTAEVEHARQIGELGKKTTLADASTFDFRKALVASSFSQLKGPAAVTPERAIGQKDRDRVTRDAEVRCHRCKELGHRIANCPNERVRRGNQPTAEKTRIIELEKQLAELRAKVGGPALTTPKTGTKEK